MRILARMKFPRTERAACGVGFVVTRTGQPSHATLQSALSALNCVEHRGAVAADGVTGDGAGVLTDIPFDLLGRKRGEVALATLFVHRQPERRRRALRIFERTFAFFDFRVLDYREVPIELDALGRQALHSRPEIIQAVLCRPAALRTNAAFNRQLYMAQQRTRSELRARDAVGDLHFASLSCDTVVYKGLLRAPDLARFYADLRDPRFITRFAVFHRRFSTNTASAWDKAQPFRMIGHNGEINTIAGNRSWSYSREQSLGLRPDELVTTSASDSGSLNQQVEAMRFRSSIPRTEDALAILMPPATERSGFYRFWGRAMEPWDGPALVTYADGDAVGARLDRNGFRPCRWAMTADTFFLASEAGLFSVPDDAVQAKGTLNAGSGVRVTLARGELHFADPSRSRENRGAHFEPRLKPLPERENPEIPAFSLPLHGVCKDELQTVLLPMVAAGKEAIGSMGDTAQVAVLSERRRSIYEFFFQDFAQVTNPPLDFLRERMVTDLSTVLGHKPNIFAPKELLPPTPAWSLPSPLLSRGQMATITELAQHRIDDQRVRSTTLPMTFASDRGPEHLAEALEQLAADALAAVDAGISVLILSDREASGERAPMPSLLALRAVVTALNRAGRRLDASVVLDAADVRNAHHLACAIGFGATAVCPWLALAIAAGSPDRSLRELSAEQREANLLRALRDGLLKVMSKVGISVVGSYQSSKLFSPLGLRQSLVSGFFGAMHSPVQGLGLEDFAADALARAALAADQDARLPLPSLGRLKELRNAGERHAMTADRARALHVALESGSDADWAAFTGAGDGGASRLSDLLQLRLSDRPVAESEVEPASAVLARFGSGAMSFGALSGKAQRDLFQAMRAVGGRSNSGEGGENPWYFIDGTTATTKQIASGRFGVTAEYLVVGDEIEIKMAQGAKPGEGGQLMGSKVSEEIARARHANPGVDLISPPPLHDIYSIEDLRQLIDELKVLSPAARVCVKLVSGKNIGTIAAGVVKAGADVIQISGGSGGTGAATLTSMMHAGLPWEIGLVDVHQALIEQDLRDRVRLRVDGGLHTAEDVVKAAILGAQELGFGKLLLVAQGCIMARICEKNRCPRGIATHEPRFLEKYQGRSEDVIALLQRLAGDVRALLARLGARALDDVVGRTGLLQPHPEHAALVAARGLDLGWFLHGSHHVRRAGRPPIAPRVGTLGARILEDARAAIEHGEPVKLRYDIRSTDRTVLTRLSGELARRSHHLRMEAIRGGTTPDHRPHALPPGTIEVDLRGTAGQGFGAFMVGGIDVRLTGAANDHVCKSMSGGRAVIVPPEVAGFDPARNVIIGNCALYGATGGTFFCHGIAGDRFAVRNSGAEAVVEGAGLHACEYMTRGTVVILGELSFNVGAGMTGGRIYVPRDAASRVNEEHLVTLPVDGAAAKELHELVRRYHAATASQTAASMLADWPRALERMRLCLPRAELARARPAAVA